MMITIWWFDERTRKQTISKGLLFVFPPHSTMSCEHTICLACFKVQYQKRSETHCINEPGPHQQHMICCGLIVFHIIFSKRLTTHPDIAHSMQSPYRIIFQESFDTLLVKAAFRDVFQFAVLKQPWTFNNNWYHDHISRGTSSLP